MTLEFKLQCLNGVGAAQLATMKNVTLNTLFNKVEDAYEQEIERREIIRFYNYAKRSIFHQHADTFRFITSLNPSCEPFTVRESILEVINSIEEDMIFLGVFYSNDIVINQCLKWEKFIPDLYGLDIPALTKFKVNCLTKQSLLTLINRHEATIIYLRNILFIPKSEINKTRIDDFYFYALKRIESDYTHFLRFINTLDYTSTESLVKEAISVKIEHLKKDMRLIGNGHIHKEFSDTIRKWG